MKTERKTAPAALRRGMVLLCTLVLTLMAITLPASAAVEGNLADSTNIGLEDGGFSDGEKPFTRGYDQASSSNYSWVANGNTITGTVKPREDKKNWQDKYQCCKGANSTLIITNRSGKAGILTFSYKAPTTGTLTIGDTNYPGSGTLPIDLPVDGKVTIKLTTAMNTAQHSQSTPNEYIAEAKLSNIEFKPIQDITVTFMKPTNGSYTVTVDNVPLKYDTPYTKSMATRYTLQATPDEGCFFDGWYANGVLISSNPTLTTPFAEDSRVEAVFVDDPLLYIIQMSEPSMAKDDYVEVDSDYRHGERSWRRKTVRDVKDGHEPVSFADPRWSANGNAIQSSASGHAEGDWQNGALGNTTAEAGLYSDVIRVKCLKNCTITFDWAIESTPKTIKWYCAKPMGSEEYAKRGAFFYYHISKNANVSDSTITGAATSVALTKSETTQSGHATITVNAGEYLYLSAYGRPMYQDQQISGCCEMDYNYSATISNFTVTPNTTEHTFTTGNRDNTEAVLKYGSVKINGTPLNVSSGTNSYKAAENAILTLTPGTAPTGYTFIGWHNVTDKEYDYTNSTYTVKMTKPYQVNPIYVPAMTITTGGTNGYGDAKYEYKNLSNETVPRDGQYVARGPIPSDGRPPAFYTSLKDAFDVEDTVFLLAEDIINGDLTIPKDKTLVIPDRLADSGPAASQPEQVTTSTGISSYCKVNLNGNLTVNGKLVVNARQSGRVDGRASGGIGYLNLSGDSTVTVNSGGELCGYGLIRGGSITAKEGSTVRELMEISDRRGDHETLAIYDNKNKGVFLFNNFSVKTIESPATYETGAKLFAQYSVALDPDSPSSGSAPLFASSGALFNLSQGSMTKYFDHQTDKTVYHLDKGGKMSTGSFKLTLKVAGVTPSIDTKDYQMPLNAGFDLRTAGDMTVSSSFKFLPGASLSVEKGGTCTVASNANLLFYRLNDYDTRGIGDGTYQKGYSAKAYPVKAADLPGGEYKHPTPETVGSARLNVDGKMIVNGGLYVSNDPVSESDQGFKTDEPVNGVPTSRVNINKAYFKPPYPYPNGYNVLTGTGTIKMTTALKDETAYEAMTAKGTNAVAFAPIKITPIKGLAADATADTQANYKSFDQKATYYGVYHLGNFYTWTDKMPQIATIVGGGSETTTYRSLADAVAAYNDTGYIQMLDNSTEPGFTVSKNVTLDLNGKTVTLDGTLTVAKDCTLSGMDSATDEYDGTNAGKIDGTVTGTVAPVFETKLKPTKEYDSLRYVSIKNEAGTEYTFHRFNISVTGYRFELAAPECALFFIGKFQGDDAAKNHLKSLGFTLTDIDGETTNLSYEIPAVENIPSESDPGESPVVRSTDGAFLFEAYLIREIDKGKPDTYQKPFSATAKATFKNSGPQEDNSLSSVERTLSFQQALWDALSAPDMEEKDGKILRNFLNDMNIPNPNPNP